MLTQQKNMTGDELKEWFEANKTLLETAYLAGQQPWQQSGFGLNSNRTVEQWTAQRRPIADCIDTSGLFLDIGCANGYLIECLLDWTRERGIEIVPYGLDISEGLAALARARLPQYAQHIFVGNAWDWAPPRTFRFVRTELEYVPSELHRMYIARLLDLYLEGGGKLLVAEYRGHGNEAPRLTIDNHLVEMGFHVEAVRVGYWDGVERTRVAIISKPSV